MRDEHACPQDVEIAAIASAVPEYRIDQEATRNIVLAIAPELRSHEGLFLNTGIKTLYSCVPFDWHLQRQGWATRSAVFRDAASHLLERVARDCAERAGIDVVEIEAIVMVSTTGLAVPGLDAVLANRLRLSPSVDGLVDRGRRFRRSSEPGHPEVRPT
jgi:alkylresorcinol/alkylpyrone synthase